MLAYASMTTKQKETVMARLPSIKSKDQVAKEDHAIFDAVVKSRGAVQGPFTMAMHCPPIAEHLVNLGGYVRFEGKLDHRVRVLAAMTVAREYDCMYVWGAQTGQARKLGVAESTINAIRERNSRGLPAEDAQIVDFTRDLINKHRVSDEVMNALQKRFGNYQLVELTVTIGYYTLLTMTANATELEPAQGAEVLKT
jgi:4-carboxymuconolactone decarboxylase